MTDDAGAVVCPVCGTLARWYGPPERYQCQKDACAVIFRHTTAPTPEDWVPKFGD